MRRTEGSNLGFWAPVYRKLSGRLGPPTSPRSGPGLAVFFFCFCFCFCSFLSAFAYFSSSVSRSDLTFSSSGAIRGDISSSEIE